MSYGRLNCAAIATMRSGSTVKASTELNLRLRGARHDVPVETFFQHPHTAPPTNHIQRKSYSAMKSAGPSVRTNDEATT